MLATAIRSLQVQEFTDWELLVIDDGSTDGTRAVVEQFRSDTRIRYHYQENQERSTARNNGIKAAKGSFICFIDSDDYYLPRHLQALHESILSHNEKPALYYTGYFFADAAGNRKQWKGFGPIKNKGLYNTMREELLQTNSVCIAASLLEEEQFPPQFNLFEDNHLWFRIIARSELIYIPEPTTVMCDHDGRSLHVSKTGFRKKTAKYDAVLSDLFLSGNYPLLDAAVSDREKKRFLASKLLVMVYEAMKLRMLLLAYALLFRSLFRYFDRTRIKEYAKLLFGIPVFVIFISRNAERSHQ